MIRVRKIAHASYEMPDLDKQAAYYTDILGLNLVAKEKDAVYLANTVDHHSVVLRKGEQAKCTRVGFQIGPQEDLNEFEKQTQKHGVKTARKKDPEPSIPTCLSLRIRRAPRSRCSSAPISRTRNSPPRAWCRTSSVMSRSIART